MATLGLSFWKWPSLSKPLEGFSGALPRDLIGLKFDVWYDVDHLSRLLHEWGFSPQKPVKRAKEQDGEAVVTWIETKVTEFEKKSGGR